MMNVELYDCFMRVGSEDKYVPHCLMYNGNLPCIFVPGILEICPSSLDSKIRHELKDMSNCVIGVKVFLGEICTLCSSHQQDDISLEKLILVPLVPPSFQN